eukprot:TRINITY_DN3127_c0_g1_i2.p1 TRINITY_DN3127_c0_g1~~TRINITY_DN3127_c0_g1_i2.p1  ORF type:complete len:145 (-),score=12.08 TRINITY_DN3127_c0_g1_i2:157-591(-)
MLSRVCKLSIGGGSLMLAQDEEFFVVLDTKPDFQLHYQVISRKHIESINSLRKGDIPFLQRMKAIGESFLETQIKYSEKPVSSYSIKYGFHIPGANSVDHLHMHCIAGKQTRMFSFAGFATADNVIKGLEELPDGSPVCLFLDY